MNNKGYNVDDFTKDLIRKSELEAPSKDFTKKVMSQILKDPSVKISFITEDDKKSNLWLLISITIMIAGSFLLYLFKNGFNLNGVEQDFQIPSFFTFFADFFIRFWNELSLSPYILIGFIGVVILVVIDRTIVKYLYSI
jgi:hypothetical protein